LDDDLSAGALLRLEYGRLQAIIDKFDDQRFKIRGWTVTVAGAFFAFGVNAAMPVIVCFGGIFVLVFFYVELIFMDIQVKVTKRSQALEAWMERARRGGVGPLDEVYVFGVGPTFSGAFVWKDIPSLLRRRSNITVFYGGLAGLMVLSGVLLALVE
jgi:uncharacterized membrane protein